LKEASQIGGSQAKIGTTQLKTLISPYSIALAIIASSAAYITRKVMRKPLQTRPEV